jgi:hypothetical protein
MKSLILFLKIQHLQLITNSEEKSFRFDHLKSHEAKDPFVNRNSSNGMWRL